jgi:hypothetical protein
MLVLISRRRKLSKIVKNSLDCLINIQYKYIMGLLKMKDITIDEKDDSDLLGQNYQEMIEMGKEKLLEVSEKLLSVFNTVNEGDKK